MTRTPSPDDICAMCDEFSVKAADPEIAAIGMGRCMIRSESSRLNLHVGWNTTPCVSYRLDKPSAGKRRQYVQMQRNLAAKLPDTVD